MMFTVVYLESIGESRGRLGSQRASAEISAQSVGSGDAPQMLPASAEKSSSSEMLLSWVLHNKCVARDVRKLTVTSGKPDQRERISRRVKRGRGRGCAIISARRSLISLGMRSPATCRASAMLTGAHCWQQAAL